MSTEAVAVLAKFFAGPAVAHFSIGLQIGGVQGKVAEQFFMTRKVLGVQGYATEDEATLAISKSLLE